MIRDAGTPLDSAELVDKEIRLALLEFAPDALLLVDDQGVIRYANGRAQGLFQYEPKELVGQPVALLLAESARGEHVSLRVESGSTSARGMGEGRAFHARRKAGEELAVEASLAPISAGKYQWTAVALRDVTAKRALESQVSGLQKVEALGKLAGAVAHDFNNILTAIGSFADLAYQAARPGSNVRVNLEEVLGATEQARLLTKKLLDFAKRRPIEPIVVDLNAIVRATERMIDVLMNNSVNVVQTLSPRAGLVRIDPGGIEQVLINLCVNAYDAMPNGGTLTLETRVAQISVEEAARLGPRVIAGSYAVLRVSDTGTGMSDDVKRQVFEPFFSTKPPGAGSGLGLATCYGLVAQAGGFIGLQSQLGQGTRVEVYLPQSTLVPAGDTVSVNPRTILVVEPDPTVRAAAGRELAQVGFTTIPAKGWVEALDAVRNQVGNVDLLLIDVGIPAADSLELASRIRRLCPSLKTLFMSQHALAVLTAKGTNIQEHEFLQKPFGTLALLQKLAHLSTIQ
jgi:PAS domain S-box-containing protein